MKKFFFTFVFLFAFSAYALYATQASTEAGQLVPVVADTASAPATVPPVTPEPSVKPTTPVVTPTPTPPKPVPSPVPAPTGRYKDGSYTGSLADAYYGYIQVRAVISGGNLTDVVFLQYPNDRGTSVEINRQAMPMLTRQALSAQSANVHGVSGASDTSIAFKESLSSALAQAS